MAVIDNATWQVFGLTLTLLLLVLSVFMWRRRGAVSGLRTVAWALLPLAAALTGVLRLAWRIVGAVGDWAVRLVFSPTMWAGVVLAGVAVVLFVVSGFLRRRSPGTPPVEAKRRPPVPGKPGGATADDDMADIEAILKKHGIS